MLIQESNSVISYFNVQDFVQHNLQSPKTYAEYPINELFSIQILKTYNGTQDANELNISTSLRTSRHNNSSRQVAQSALGK